MVRMRGVGLKSIFTMLLLGSGACECEIRARGRLLQLGPIDYSVGPTWIISRRVSNQLMSSEGPSEKHFIGQTCARDGTGGVTFTTHGDSWALLPGPWLGVRYGRSRNWISSSWQGNKMESVSAQDMWCWTLQFPLSGETSRGREWEQTGTHRSVPFTEGIRKIASVYMARRKYADCHCLKRQQEIGRLPMSMRPAKSQG